MKIASAILALGLYSFVLLAQAGGHDSADSSIVSGEVSAPGAVLGEAKITVTLNGVNIKDGGTMIVTLFKEEKTWLKTKKALRNTKFKLEQGANLTVTFEGLAPDSDYAIQALHDANDNGKMDMKFLPFPQPKEGSGFSNNYQPSGFPKYEGAKIKLTGSSLETAINLQYP
ncbi:DUF2141 domain-containing protein [Oceanicoccus sp. KOV_DT_Chl]|uniref:DUF2141 domain-containing protein n=1 Tax=Oceanicoccus sp. KOV_DT_Chl TaxID=1904639 RepID=UPI0013592634|nr:DUF2141 domain-containing protein [Oceanicoccus sp. KOV_DT_Chl]